MDIVHKIQGLKGNQQKRQIHRFMLIYEIVVTKHTIVRMEESFFLNLSFFDN